MTERLYYQDATLTAFTAQVVERTTIDDHPAVVLDRTAFYPTGGGQPHDTGTLNGVTVIDVQNREADGAVVHVLEGELGADEASGQVEWARRFDLMQHHTGQHVLSQAFVEVASAQTVGFHLSEATVTIDLDRADLSPETVATVEDLANRIVFEDRPVTARLVDPDDTGDVRVRHIPDALHTDGLRVIEVEDFDSTACGGTHVARTGEIGLIKVLKVENYKDGSRITFCCGGRALHDYQEKHDILDAASNRLTVGYWEVGDAIERLRGELKDTQRALKTASDRLAEVEAAELLAGAEMRGPVRLIRLAEDGRDVGEVRALVSRLVEQPGVVVLAGVAGPKAQLILAHSSDLSFNLNDALQPALAALGTDRGGGRPDFCQGGGVEADIDAIEAALAAAEQALPAFEQSAS